MKFIRFFYLFITIATISFAQEIVNLHPEKNEFYSKPFLSGKILFDPNRYPVVFLNIDYSIFDPFTYYYSTDLEKFFYVNTETFISILQHYRFKNNHYFYFLVLDSTKKNQTKRLLFLVDIKSVKKYNIRDFGENDDKLLDSNNINKYELLPIYDLLKTFKVVVINKKNEFLVSKKLTKQYHEFLIHFYSEITGERENKIIQLQNEKKDLQKNIWLYCTNGDINKINLYLNLKFNINKKDPQHDQTCLQYASVNGHYKIVKLLIDNGADPNIHKAGFENAYLAAKRRGYTKIAKLLKPITTMTEYPVSSSSRYASSDMKNMCLGASGKYPTFCYNIDNHDLKNSCLAVRQYPSFAYKISNNDLKNFTLGVNGQNPSACYQINNSDLKNACLGINNNTVNCYNIQDRNIQNMCLGISKNTSFCYSIQ